MRIKEGVEYKKEGLVKILLAGEKVYNHFGKELVITSLMDGKHMKGSKHYTGNAADFRTYYFNPHQIEQVASLLRQELGFNYDVVVEKDHIHVEFDPK